MPGERDSMAGWGLGDRYFSGIRNTKIGFGYVPTSLNVLDLVNERGKAYQAEVLRCIERMNRQRGKIKPWRRD